MPDIISLQMQMQMLQKKIDAPCMMATMNDDYQNDDYDDS